MKIVLKGLKLADMVDKVPSPGWPWKQKLNHKREKQKKRGRTDALPLERKTKEHSKALQEGLNNGKGSA